MNRFQRNIIVAVAIVFVVVMLLQFNSYDNSSEFGGNGKDHYYPTLAEDYWTGLPISRNNPLYHDPSKDWKAFSETKEEMKRRFVHYTKDDWAIKDDNNHDVILAAIFDEFAVDLGWNGVFDALQEYEDDGDVDFPSTFVHWLGELLYSRTDTPRHAVEVASRDILHKAPLHASVWSAIEAQGLEDLDAMFSLVFDELCYFRDLPGMGDTWISCAHGVGHGLGMLKPDNIADALDVCGAVDDGEFQYACATGIFMNADMDPTTFAPCDTNRFPAACYRFASPLFSKLEEHNIKGQCDTQCDPYHKMGCIYGQRYVSKDSDLKHICKEYWPRIPNQEPESLYHAACVEGYFATRTLKQKTFEAFCDSVKANHASYEVCERKRDFDRKNVTLSDDTYYNADLFETYYDPLTAHNCSPAKIPS